MANFCLWRTKLTGLLVKAKAVPVHATEALDGGEWPASRSGRDLPPGKGPPVPIVQVAGWALEPVWTQRLEEKSFRLCRGSNLDPRSSSL
jgi:hypothetical protein